MAIFKAGKFLLMFLMLFLSYQKPSAAQLTKPMLYGTWVADKSLYDKTMEIAFDKKRQVYRKQLKNAKTNVVINKVEATYVIVNDSTNGGNYAK